MKKWITIILSGLTLVVAGSGLFLLSPFKTAAKYYGQVTMERIPSSANVQPAAQTNATYVGSKTCAECHLDIYNVQHYSMHPKMIQDVKADPSVIVADFSTLPEGASFTREEIVYTIGSKFKQRFMIRKDTPGKEGYPEENYIIGNYQWNMENQKWQGYNPTKDWYHDAWPEDQEMVFTSHTCDGCHFTGFNSQSQRVEPGVNCENCHGPGSVHALDGQLDSIYMPTKQDPQRAMEVCLQCHMRNVDKRLEDPAVTVKDLYDEARDYPYGYEPGMPLTQFKKQAPHKSGVDDSKFYGNGIGKKNRMQGNDYVQSMMYKHGITCMNCHDPHAADNTAENPRGAKQCMECHKFGSPLGPHQRSEFAHSHHEAGPDAPDCIDCHMPKIGKHTGKSPHTVRTHAFRFIYPQESIDYGLPNACNNCHSKPEQTPEWASQKLEEWGMTTWERY
jgi:hypothetical protein